MEKNAATLAVWDEFSDTIQAVKAHWHLFPLELKLKVTFANSIKVMLSISEVKIEDSSDMKPLDQKVQNFADSFFIHLGLESWDAEEPSFGAISVEAFKVLNGLVSDMQDGNLDDSGNDIETAAAVCGRVLEDRAFV